MITFNLQAHNGNYYSGHEPSNRGNCWDDEEHALVLSIEQARAIASARPGHMNIVISVRARSTFNTAEVTDGFERELYCAGGGSWYDWPHREVYARMQACKHMSTDADGKLICPGCGARRTSPSRRWYEPGSGKAL